MPPRALWCSLAFSLALSGVGCSSDASPAAGSASGGTGGAGGRPSASAGAAGTPTNGTAGGGALSGGGAGGGLAGAGASGALGNASGAANGGSAGSLGAGGAGGSLAGAGGSLAGAGGSGGTSQSGGSGGAGGTASTVHSGPWRITPLGDSITGTTCGPQLLSQELKSKGKTNFSFIGTNLNNQSCNGAPNVQTEGHGGYLVTDLVGSGKHASELPQWCATDKPDIVLMHFGTNDVWNNVAASTILDAYGAVLGDLRAVSPNVIVFVAQIIPMNPSGCSECESRVETLNSQIPTWAASKSSTASPIYVVDQHSVFDPASYQPSSQYTADGVHPNAAGGQRMADKWYAALSAQGLP